MVFALKTRVRLLQVVHVESRFGNLNQDLALLRRLNGNNSIKFDERFYPTKAIIHYVRRVVSLGTMPGQV